MYLPQPAQPTYVKALIVTAPFVSAVAWLVHFIIAAPILTWVIFVGIASMIVAAVVHSRVTDDWRARYGMNLEIFEKRNSVGRNIRIDRR
jgi:uncharacterized membrane protein